MKSIHITAEKCLLLFFVTFLFKVYLYAAIMYQIKITAKAMAIVIVLQSNFKEIILLSRKFDEIQARSEYVSSCF